MAALTFRRAHPDDAAACIALRGQTRENAFSEAELGALGITVDTWSEGTRLGATPGYVACQGERIVGYCFGDRDTGEILVLALLPDHEGQGTGRALLERTVDHLRQQGHARLFLSCSSDPGVRSYGFYRHLGWTPTGTHDDAGDEILTFDAGRTA
ncbi:GNAT family N-acetyltransferase [Stenotrophomonas mori]|uniref:GNAT family N-acetyltransferase n=1 Tax=Stenotrophomonas mori TaxID=2871096 RepID=A0ABT0SFJ0_9GAMM|nr:GNAT family N-acetyltransferase [Stenotrophomonas mori]MCL7714089.1 GNAT family N-acetyltransferase [Stenotrophomonas mori]